MPQQRLKKSARLKRGLKMKSNSVQTNKKLSPKASIAHDWSYSTWKIGPGDLKTGNLKERK